MDQNLLISWNSVLPLRLMRSDQINSLWTSPTRPEQRKRPEHPYRPEQTNRPDSGHPLPVQSSLSVKNLDVLLGSNCVVF